jgi:hypothetical protein
LGQDGSLEDHAPYPDPPAARHDAGEMIMKTFLLTLHRCTGGRQLEARHRLVRERPHDAVQPFRCVALAIPQRAVPWVCPTATSPR